MYIAFFNFYTMNYSKDEQAIADMHVLIIDAFNNGDLEKLLSVHTEDVVIMEPHRSTIQGIEEVREVFTKAFDHVKKNGILFKLSFKIHELEVWGDRAFARGQVNKITRNADGTDKLDAGKYLCLFRKQADGSWLRSHIISNEDAAPDPSEKGFWKD